MAHEEEEGADKTKRIRVVDRRRFNSEGEARADAPERREPVTPPLGPPSAPQAQPQSPSAPRAPAPRDAGRADARSAPPAGQRPAAAAAPREPDNMPPRRGPEPEFISFIASLATNALASLGAIPEARAQGVPVNPDIAREYIDIIAMLQEKTRGNLSREEDAAMQRLLTELRMHFVELTQRPQR